MFDTILLIFNFSGKIDLFPGAIFITTVVFSVCVYVYTHTHTLSYWLVGFEVQQRPISHCSQSKKRTEGQAVSKWLFYHIVQH